MRPIASASPRRSARPTRCASWRRVRSSRDLSPYGPLDPKDRPGRAGSLFAPPLPHIVIACGRVTVPYMRAIKRAAGRHVFTVFLQDPRASRAQHGPDLGARTRRPCRRQCHLDFDLAPSLLGGAARRGESGARPAHRRAARARAPRSFWAARAARTTLRRPMSQGCAAAAAAIAGAGYSVMATPSRRTPPELVARGARGPRRRASLRLGRRRRQSLCADARPCRRHPGDRRQRQYGRRGDRHRRAGLCLRTLGRGGGKIARYIDALERLGAVRRFAGRIERFSYEPIDSSLTIAREIARRFRRLRSRGLASRIERRSNRRYCGG